MAEPGKDTVERDDKTGTETTGHVWDGIRELDTPLPRWWLWTFYATIIWALIYTIAYPAWPMITRATSGVLGYSSRMELEEKLAEAEAAIKPIEEKIAAASFDEIKADESLSRFAKAGGAAIFRTYCAQCHGTGAAGTLGHYPNLRDDDWLWGGTPEAIETTITHGIRWAGDEETRSNDMPAFGDDEILSPAEI
ncbi:MAG: cytochrome-c oxidase, cbb3-type subunit III, partial [Alphaproteobacteria bacterium]